MDSLAGTGDVTLATVNGSVVAELPETFDGDVDLSTVNGSFKSDFPTTVSGRIDPHHLHATIGDGGRQLTMKTVNGSVALRKISERAGRPVAEREP
jgi:DUF4097 and DUF4098 domain-containing protein YvlB